jgi:hypothetical protein
MIDSTSLGRKLVLISAFFDAVETNTAEHSEWRYGQTLFNTLYQLHPDVANSVRATDADPFHAQDSSDPRIDKFFWYIARNL